jgi:hypothetical protein
MLAPWNAQPIPLGRSLFNWGERSKTLLGSKPNQPWGVVDTKKCGDYHIKRLKNVVNITFFVPSLFCDNFHKKSPKRYCIDANNTNNSSEYDDDHRDDKNNSNFPESIQKGSRFKMIRKRYYSSGSNYLTWGGPNVTKRR